MEIGGFSASKLIHFHFLDVVRTTGSDSSFLFFNVGGGGGLGKEFTYCSSENFDISRRERLERIFYLNLKFLLCPNFKNLPYFFYPIFFMMQKIIYRKWTINLIFVVFSSSSLYYHIHLPGHGSSDIINSAVSVGTWYNWKTSFVRISFYCWKKVPSALVQILLLYSCFVYGISNFSWTVRS